MWTINCLLLEEEDGSNQGCTVHSAWGLAFVLAKRMWILSTLSSTTVCIYHTGHVKGSFITEKEVVLEDVIFSPPDHVHSKFFSMWPIVLFQCSYYLDFVCMELKTVMDIFLHSYLGNSKLYARRMDGSASGCAEMHHEICQHLRMVCLPS